MSVIYKCIMLSIWSISLVEKSMFCKSTYVSRSISNSIDACIYVWPKSRTIRRNSELINSLIKVVVFLISPPFWMYRQVKQKIVDPKFDRNLSGKNISALNIKLHCVDSLGGGKQFSMLNGTLWHNRKDKSNKCACAGKEKSWFDLYIV